MEDSYEEIILKTSRIYFLGNYLIAGLVVIFLILSYFIFDLSFTLFPKTQNDLLSTITILGIFALAAGLVEQPEWARFRTKFMVTMNEVIKQEGILAKERVILPYATVADIRVEKSIIGRLMNYGNLSVSSFKAGSDMIMKGVRKPDRIHATIQNRVNLIREGQLQMFKGKEEKGEI